MKLIKDSLANIFFVTDKHVLLPGELVIEKFDEVVADMKVEVEQPVTEDKQPVEAVKETFKPNKTISRNCEYCNKQFEAKRTNQRFCCSNCRTMNWKRKKAHVETK